MEENGKSFAMNVGQRKDALDFVIRLRRDFILGTRGLTRLGWTGLLMGASHFANVAVSLDPNVGTDRMSSDNRQYGALYGSPNYQTHLHAVECRHFVGANSIVEVKKEIPVVI